MLGNGDHPWRLRGTSRQVAWFVAIAFAAAAVMVAVVDRYTEAGWGSPLLQAWTLVPQTLAALGLLYLAKRRNSVAFLVLALLIALIVVEEAFHVLNPLAAWLARVARWAQQWTDIRLRLLNSALTYGFVAAVGLGLLAFSHWRGTRDERPVVRNMTVLLLLGGFFGGPVSVLSTMRDPRRWMFVEELGEAIVFALIIGYVAGLIAAVFTRRLSRPRATAS